MADADRRAGLGVRAVARRAQPCSASLSAEFLPAGDAAVDPGPAGRHAPVAPAPADQRTGAGRRAAGRAGGPVGRRVALCGGINARRDRRRADPGRLYILTRRGLAGPAAGLVGPGRGAGHLVVVGPAGAAVASTASRSCPTPRAPHVTTSVTSLSNICAVPRTGSATWSSTTGRPGGRWATGSPPRCCRPAHRAGRRPRPGRAGPPRHASQAVPARLRARPGCSSSRPAT